MCIRDRVHENGDLHGTAHVWIVRPTGTGSFELLLQKRSAHKDSYPGCYDISAAGHVPAGCGYLDSALRELEEELGIKAQPGDLQQAFLHLGYAEAEFYGKPFKNAEASMVYLYSKPIKAEDLKLQETEVAGVRWMEYGALLEEVRREAKQGKAGKYCIFLEELEQVGKYVRPHKG